MPSISDKLKALGVQVGAQDITPPPAPATRHPFCIENVLDGRPLPTHQGETYLVERFYAETYRLGTADILRDVPLHVLSEWAGERGICDYPPQAFAYIDTETTGLSGGAGTYTFLIGAGRFEAGHFHLAQFFLRDPLEEPAQLAALEEFLAPCSAVVSFNGKAFDIPLLNTRFTTHGLRSPFKDLAHIDLLHLARRLWRDRLPSRSLGNLEVQILGAQRSEDDVPGWMIPSLYFTYLRSGDARDLKSVFYHNEMDVISMAALFYHTAGLLADPLQSNLEHGVDVAALARLYEDLGRLDQAAGLYLHGLDHDLPPAILLDSLLRLAMLYKRQGQPDQAIHLWEQAAHHHSLEAHLELAKYYEHQARDYPQACQWTQAALDLVNGPHFPAFERAHTRSELEHRLDRIHKKEEYALTRAQGRPARNVEKKL